MFTALLAAVVIAAPSPRVYNVEWSAPSTGPGTDVGKKLTYQDAMPLGNGRVTAIAWANTTLGGIGMYFGSQEAMALDTTLYKLAHLQVAVTPNPFTASALFNQTLDVSTGTVYVALGAVTLAVSVDANHDVLRITVHSPSPVSISVTSTSTRPADAPWSNNRGSTTCAGAASNPDVYVDPIPPVMALKRASPNALKFRHASGAQRPLRTLRTIPRVGSFQAASIIAYHRNDASEGDALDTLFKSQGIESLVKTTPDFWTDRQSGFVLEGEPGASALKRVDPHTLASDAPNTSFALRATVLAVQTSTAAEWTEDLAALVATAPPAAVARSAHEAWWASFWARSHIEINATRWPALPAAGNDAGFKTSQMYAITRYTQAIQSRNTMWPIKFNGMAFVAQMGNNGEADTRMWGSCNWWQNTRLPYGAMLAAGDYDTFETILKYKLNQEAMLSQRTQLYFGHPGMWTTETSHLTGAYRGDDYGCARDAEYPIQYEASGYLRVDQGGDSGGPEYALMAMDFLLWSSANASLPTQGAQAYLRLATQVAEYYLHHFTNKSADGKVLVWPAQVLETFWCDWNATLNTWTNCCANDSPTIR